MNFRQAWSIVLLYLVCELQPNVVKSHAVLHRLVLHDTINSGFFLSHSPWPRSDMKNIAIDIGCTAQCWQKLLTFGQLTHLRPGAAVGLKVNCNTDLLHFGCDRPEDMVKYFLMQCGVCCCHAWGFSGNIARSPHTFST